jgi:hypothetical protein
MGGTKGRVGYTALMLITPPGLPIKGEEVALFWHDQYELKISSLDNTLVLLIKSLHSDTRPLGPFYRIGHVVQSFDGPLSSAVTATAISRLRSSIALLMAATRSVNSVPLTFPLMLDFRISGISLSMP